MTWFRLPNWSGANMRCPKCNQYLPDRCTCNGPSIEQRRNAGAPNLQQIPRVGPMDPELKREIEQRRAGMVGLDFEKLETLMTITDHTPGMEPLVRTLPLSRSDDKNLRFLENYGTGLGPVDTEQIFAATSVGLAGAFQRALPHLQAASAAMHRALAPRRDSPAGSNAGQFQVYFPNDPRAVATWPASGNARQRRRQVRIWKSKGFTVKQFNPATRITIER